MSTKPAPDPIPAPPPGAAPQPGYADWLKAEIAKGVADIEAGRVTPASQVWSEIDIE